MYFNALDRTITNCTTRPRNLHQGRHQGLSSRITLWYASQDMLRIFHKWEHASWSANFRGNISWTHARAATNTNSLSHQTEDIHPQGPLHVLSRLLENWCSEITSSTTVYYEDVKGLVSYLSSKLREKKSWSQWKDWNQPTLPKRTCHMSNSLVNLQGHILGKKIHILCQRWLWQCQ